MGPEGKWEYRVRTWKRACSINKRLLLSRLDRGDGAEQIDSSNVGLSTGQKVKHSTVELIVSYTVGCVTSAGLCATEELLYLSHPGQAQLYQITM